LGVERWTFETMSIRIIAADHTGITVSNLERSLAFWRDVLGFELSHCPHQTGEQASEITGVTGAEISIAVLKGYGHKIELLEYLAPAERKRIELRPCDVGSVHVAFTVDNLDAILNTIAASGWKAAGKPQTITVGPNTGKRVVYVRDPDGTTIEFMEMPRELRGRNPLKLKADRLHRSGSPRA
jgi:catechol 2,3-dioxygenase-like lactoylglutathione lyase family enzyme